MSLTKADAKDIPAIMEIVEDAKKYMHDKGIPQWINGYPDEETFLENISSNCLYVYKEGEEILAVLAVKEYEPTYEYIEGKWLHDDPYIVIHRMAVKDRRKGQGIAGKVFEELKRENPHIRIDTHEKNASMKRCVLKNGFVYCGVIYLEDGSPRNAYEYHR